MRRLAVVVLLLISGLTNASDVDSNAALQSQIEALKAQIESMIETKNAKAEMPVAIYYRQAILGPGLVAMIHTTSSARIPVIATFSNPSLGTSKQFELHLTSTPTKIGYAQGFILESGDTITIENKNYSPTTFTVSY